MSKARTGIVYLVGAGPGDPNLITLKAKTCIERADVILYDRLVSPSLLKQIPAHVEKVYVGKLPDHHFRPQDEINRLLVEYALQGKTVTRLKGGDPFVFGRGGEEAEALAKHGIPFEIVPGITSAIAVPAYAGIPVTHRDYTASFTVVTGHEHPEKDQSAVDWQHIAKSDNTTIFLMGVGQIRQITEQLIRHGRDKDTPVAIIRWGTRVEQRTLTGTLATIVELVTEQRFKGPAIIIIGEVVRLRDKLAWFEKKPLFGQRIVVTRARKQASTLAARIEDLGGEAYEFPVIEIQPPSDCTLLQQALQQIHTFQWLIFTSVNGVEACFEQLFKLKLDVRTWATVKIAAIGEKTAEALQAKGIIPDLVPQEYVGEALVSELLQIVQASDRIFLPRADIARKVLPQLLRDHGCEVVEVDAYDTKRVQNDANEIEALVELLRAHAIQIITFTSSSTVRNFMAVLDEYILQHMSVENSEKQNEIANQGNIMDQLMSTIDLLQDVKIACIGPVTAETARDLGLPVHIQAQKYTIEGLLQAILESEGVSDNDNGN